MYNRTGTALTGAVRTGRQSPCNPAERCRLNFEAILETAPSSITPYRLMDVVTARYSHSGTSLTVPTAVTQFGQIHSAGGAGCDVMSPVVTSYASSCDVTGGSILFHTGPHHGVGMWRYTEAPQGRILQNLLGGGGQIMFGKGQMVFWEGPNSQGRRKRGTGGTRPPQ